MSLTGGWRDLRAEARGDSSYIDRQNRLNIVTLRGFIIPQRDTLIYRVVRNFYLCIVFRGKECNDYIVLCKVHYMFSVYNCVFVGIIQSVYVEPKW